MSSVKTKFVSRNLRKVRWLPRNSAFVTCSAGDVQNFVSIWRFPTRSNGDIEDEFIANDPVEVNSVPFNEDVTELKITSFELAVAGLSSGSICLLKYSDDILQQFHQWNSIHLFRNKCPAPVTGLSVKGRDLASVGEDGKLCVFNFDTQEQIHEIASPDSCSITCINHLRYHEVVVGNSLGYLRIWDLRVPKDPAFQSLDVTSDRKGISCMNIHSTQSHILACGLDDGSMCIWDMRQEKRPVSLLKGHSAMLTELLFHPSNPDYIYTCSLDGFVRQWDSSCVKTSFSAPSNKDPLKAGGKSKGNTWLNSETAKEKLQITTISSHPWTGVNTLDIADSVLVWATDNAELCMAKDFNL